VYLHFSGYKKGCKYLPPFTNSKHSSKQATEILLLNLEALFSSTKNPLLLLETLEIRKLFINQIHLMSGFDQNASVQANNESTVKQYTSTQIEASTNHISDPVKAQPELPKWKSNCGLLHNY